MAKPFRKNTNQLHSDVSKASMVQNWIIAFAEGLIFIRPSSKFFDGFEFTSISQGLPSWSIPMSIPSSPIIPGD